MEYKVLGNIPSGGERRRYEASGVELEVDEQRGFRPTWVGHAFLPHLKNLRGTVLDFGCGSGIFGLHAAVQASVDRVIFLDISEDALALSRDNAQWNMVTHKCEFLNTVDQIQSAVDCVIANLPENPCLDFCGPDGSDLQREVLLRQVPRVLSADGQVITKSVDYAGQWQAEGPILEKFVVNPVGKTCGLTPPNLGEPRIARAKIYTLNFRSYDEF